MDTEQHLLTLKVMRLTKPTLQSPLPLTCDSKDLPGNLLNNSLQQDPTAVKGTETICCGEFLLLPQSPVNIYLGETFSSYVCVFSETQQVVKNIYVKVDMQTCSQKLPLSMNPPTPVLPPDETINIIINHEVKEIGTHILVCEVSYNNAMGIPSTFRKFFKIQVLKPLDVFTKFYNAENDDVYLEAQVQNITSGPICLEKVALDASHLFDVTSLNSTPNGKSIFGNVTLVQPQSICQFLYCLTPNEKLLNDIKVLSGPLNIGKLDIVWRSNLGEKGKLQTSQLQKMGTEYGDIRLTIEEIPNLVNLDELFIFKCKLFNNCERNVELTLSLENADGLSWIGMSGKKLESLPPRQHQFIEFKAVPVKTGLIYVSGIKLSDTFLKMAYNFDQLDRKSVV